MPSESFIREIHKVDEFNFDSSFVNSDNSASRSLGQGRRLTAKFVTLCQIGLRWLKERMNLGFLPPLFTGSFKPLEAI
jgi:hypothetical protein